MGICLSAHIRGLPISWRRESNTRSEPWRGRLQEKERHSPTWYDDHRFRGVNPVVRPDVDKVFGYYVPLRPIQDWWRYGLQDAIYKARGGIAAAFLSRSGTLGGGLCSHVGDDKRCLWSSFKSGPSS